MNKIFKVIWNPATGSYTVASETAKSRGKKSGRSKLLISALVAGGLLSSFSVWANAGNDDGQGIGTGTGWVAIGESAKATAYTDSNGASTAVGYKSNAQGVWSSAIGALTSALGDSSMAFGVNAVSTGQRSIAMGASSSSLGEYSIALGRYASSGGMFSLAQGDRSNAAGLNATAVGSNSNAAGAKAIALGNAAKATEIMSIALGDTANASKEYSMALGVSSAASAANAIAVGRNSAAAGVDSLALGRLSVASAANAIAMGAESEAAENATAIGNNAHAKGVNSIAMGSGSIADKVNTIALGNGSQSLADNAIAIGQGNKANGTDAIALGNASLSSGLNSIALGKTSVVTGDNSLALGSNTNANGINSVALGADSIADQDNSVSVGSSSLQRKIVNVKNGAIKADSHDAINGSQLYAISDSIAKRLGGGSSVNPDDGTVNAPTYNLKNGNKNNVGSALTVLDENTLQWDQIKGKYSAVHGSSTTSVITDVANGTISAASKDAVNGSQLYDLQQDALLWNGTAFSAAHGTEATSKITNVTAGNLTASSTDAVNGSQLKTTNDNVTTNTTNIATNTTNITNLTDAVNGLGDDSLLWNKTAGAFSAAHGTDATSKITNVKAGDLTAGSTDAVNGSQLKTTNDNVTTNTTNIATNTTNITNLTDAVNGLGDDSLLWNKTAGAFSAAHGTDATSKITNVKAGDLTAGSTDAVNGSQLKTTNDNVSTNTTNITNLTDSVGDLKDDSLLWNKAAGAFSAAHGTEATSKITNLLAGKISSNSTDAINGSQLYGVADSFTSYLGGGADISDTGVLSGPTYTIGGTDYTNVGDALAAINTSFSTSLGDALLWDATAGKFSAKHGINNAPSVITDVANGAVSSTSSDAINGSQLYGVSDYIADALGGNAVVNTDGSITTPTYAIAGGSYNNVGDALEAIDTTLDDALLWDTTANGGNGAFSAAHGKDKTASVITNVANGAVSATSSDAINGSQLYSTNKYIADALGGDAEVNADGTITAPTYTIANTDYNNVGEALDALDNNALLWDEDAGAYNASHDGNASKITNVAAGDLSTTSTDAVNGSQLNATNILVTQNSQMINQLAGNTSETYIEDNGAGINYVRTNDTGLTFTDASAAGIGSTAVGYNTVAKGDSSVAMGYNSFAKGDSSVAIGQGSYSGVDTGIALGSSSVSSRVIVKGSRNTSVSEEGVVIGYDTTDGELLGALSIGDDGKYRQIINVADGSEAHDAVTVRQLQNAIGAVATTPTKYYHANSTAEDSLAVGEDSLAMGAKTIVNGNAGIGIGLNTLVLADAINGIAIGSNARANHADSIAMGNGSQTTRGAQTNYTAYNMDAPQNSVGEFSVGSEDGQRQITNVAAGSADTDAVNVGQLKVTDAQVSQNTQSITNLNTQVTNLDTRVTNIENGIGDIVTTGSTKYFKTNTDGADANAQGKDSVAIGSGSIAAADNSVALGTGSVANEENTISVGSSTNQRRITNVAAGVNATDAVNVSQLKSSEAGGVRYDTKADGSIDYSNITLGGGNGGTTRISNVSAGVNNNDAVNYAQLKQSVQETKQYTDQRMVEMDNKLSKTESKLSGGIASAMAMTGLPQAYTPGASMASIGGGTYNGESAVALGVSMVSANGRWVYKLQGSTNSQGEYSAALGAGIQW
ncbi:YadA-like family protein [Escherichia coli]|uniref:YadA-like family protein n=2 Tax=Escherichia coli TaxID=562 RepID=UPI0004DABA4E|nr:YadA-like family protein [Escherichia coli]KEM19088.1 putative inner membrane protein [Escherichia coli 6-319-05_S3_C1]KEM58500.1 putative inner membrane protein [Escherichia coli 6-319-05_S3_C3]KUT56878.1 adhesin [Escherichia coli]MBB7874523.1 YadA-like family protein [Escherichia coli]MBJ0323802.1 YadA-like family protein [Escherichia coli]